MEQLRRSLFWSIFVHSTIPLNNVSIANKYFYGVNGACSFPINRIENAVLKYTIGMNRRGPFTNKGNKSYMVVMVLQMSHWSRISWMSQEITKNNQEIVTTDNKEIFK